MIQNLEKSNAIVEGFSKQVDAGAMNLIMDITQSDQYQHPWKSMVREVVSNAKDAVDEKKVAKRILTGESKVEDHFIQRDGSLYKDSNWDEEYYNLKYLSDDDRVKITYIENYNRKEIGFCDLFVVEDKGVGIGNDRIVGFTKLGYSTKRNSQRVLGSFGLGNKAPLSTGVESFIVESAHNGKLIRLEIFNYKISSLIGPMNMETGEQNKYHTFDLGKDEKGNDITVDLHYEKTDSTNYTRIIVPCKKAGRKKIDDAIKEVLPYVKGIDYYYVNKEGSERKVNFQPKIEYESSRILVTNNRRWDKVQVAIVKDPTKQKHDVCISYGHIDFEEMNITPVKGAVAIKCPIRSVIRDPSTGKEQVLQEGIDVVP